IDPSPLPPRRGTHTSKHARPMLGILFVHATKTPRGRHGIAEQKQAAPCPRKREPRPDMQTRFTLLAPETVSETETEARGASSTSWQTLDTVLHDARATVETPSDIGHQPSATSHRTSANKLILTADSLLLTIEGYLYDVRLVLQNPVVGFSTAERHAPSRLRLLRVLIRRRLGHLSSSGSNIRRGLGPLHHRHRLVLRLGLSLLHLSLDGRIAVDASLSHRPLGGNRHRHRPPLQPLERHVGLSSAELVVGEPEPQPQNLGFLQQS
ncbi:hypothetical protein BN1708_009502, partial [Verticillium longisporum]